MKGKPAASPVVTSSTQFLPPPASLKNCHNIDVDGWHGQVFPYGGMGPFHGGTRMTTIGGAQLSDGSLVLIWAGGSDANPQVGEVRMTVEPENMCAAGALQAVGAGAVSYDQVQRSGPLSIIAPMEPPFVRLAYVLPDGSLRDDGLTFDTATKAFCPHIKCEPSPS